MKITLREVTGRTPGGFRMYRHRLPYPGEMFCRCQDCFYGQIAAILGEDDD
jgi:hypothetical protein